MLLKISVASMENTLLTYKMQEYPIIHVRDHPTYKKLVGLYARLEELNEELNVKYEEEKKLDDRKDDLNQEQQDLFYEYSDRLVANGYQEHAAREYAESILECRAKLARVDYKLAAIKRRSEELTTPKKRERLEVVNEIIQIEQNSSPTGSHVSKLELLNMKPHQFYSRMRYVTNPTKEVIGSSIERKRQGNTRDEDLGRRMRESTLEDSDSDS
jgi:hypothetical protein